MKKLNYLPYMDAYNLALAKAKKQTTREVILTNKALDHVLAEDIIVRKNLPSFDNSAMDGFAFKHIEKGQTLQIISTIFAGDKPEAILEKGSCYKIMTGAKIPSDADTVVPIENCSELTVKSVQIPHDIQKGNAFRTKGEEQKIANVLFSKGERITPAHIALLSAQGIVAIKVYKTVQIAVVSTGDEIKEPWENADEDEIYYANDFAITSLLQKYGFTASYAGYIQDSLDKSVAFIAGLKNYDVIITTGGISMGDADFLEEAFVSNGLEILFHGIDVKPGRPTMMGSMGDTFVMAMPGNPLTAMINIFLFSIPILSRMQGTTLCHHNFIYAKNTQTFKVRSGRSNVVLGLLKNGEFHVTRNNKYGSGMLTPIVESNALVLLNDSISLVEEGLMLKVILFDTLPSVDENKTIN